MFQALPDLNKSEPVSPSAGVGFRAELAAKKGQVEKSKLRTLSLLYRANPLPLSAHDFSPLVLPAAINEGDLSR